MSGAAPETRVVTPDENMGHGTTVQEGGLAQCNSTLEQAPYHSADDSCSQAAIEGLAHWLVAQIQLPGFVADEDWTPKHTWEFARFCHDDSRKQWFLWLNKPSGRSPPSIKDDGESGMERWGTSRLSFGDELPAHCFGPMLQRTVVEEPSGHGHGLVFVGKRNAIVKTLTAESQLICLSFHGDVLTRLAAIIRGVHIPVLGDNHAWPQSFRRELLRRLSNYVGRMTDIVHRAQGCAKLLLPLEDLGDTAGCLRDRDLVQRLEALVVCWTRQVKEVLALQDGPEGAVESGHLGEIQRWTEHAQNLASLLEQFQEESLDAVIKILIAAKSPYVKPFQAAQHEVAAAAHLADENLKFLEVLRGPCQALREADSSQIPQVATRLLMAVRIVATHSKYYTTPDRIGGLLRNIAGEIIRRGQASINVDSIWSGNVAEPMESLKSAVQCGLALNKIFSQLSTLIKEEGKALCCWDFADGAAFAERCSDLLDVCQAQLQFNPTVQLRQQGAADASQEGFQTKSPQQNSAHQNQLPYFGAFQTESIRSNIRDMQETFGKSLSRLRAMGRNVLHVKATNWHTEYALFKEQVRDQECMYTNVIATAFKRVATVEEACEIYDGFKILAKRPKIQRFLEKKAGDVWKLFLQASGSKFTWSRAAFLVTRVLHPNKSGAALWCRGAALYLQRQLQALRRVALPTDGKDAEQAFELYETITSMLQPEERRLFQHHFGVLDKKIAPGIQKLTWNSKGIKEFFVRDVWKDCLAVSEYVNRFQFAKRAIAAIMEAATQVRLICVDKKTTRELEDFLCQQTEAQKAALLSLKDHHGELVDNILNVQELFKEQGKDVQREWTAFVDKIDIEWRETLRKIARASLQELVTALYPKESKRNSVDAFPLLRIFAVLCLTEVDGNGSRMAFDPPMDKLKTAVEGICNDAIHTLTRLPKLCESLETRDTPTPSSEEGYSKAANSWYSALAADDECEKLTSQEYSDYQSDIQQEESKTVICFLETDFTQLKQSLLEQCHMKRTSFTAYLHESARKEQHAVFDFIEFNVSEEETANLEKLTPAIDGFAAALEAAEAMLIRTKKAMKVDTEILVNVLGRRASELFKQFTTSAPFDGSSFNYEAATAFGIIEGFKAEISKLSADRDQLVPILDFFGIEYHTSRDLEQMQSDIEKLWDVWSLKNEWDAAWESMSAKPFYSLDVPEIRAQGEAFLERLLGIKEGRDWAIWRKVHLELEQLTQALPLITNLLDPSIRDRHWDRIKAEVAEKFDQRSPEFTLKSVFHLELLRRSDLIARLTDEAKKEFKIEVALNEIIAVWSSLELNIVPYKTNMLRVEADEGLMATLEEHLLSLSTIKSDQFHFPFKDIVLYWESTLSTIAELLELLQQVQRQWAYLENVFRGSEDIRILLPQEATLFDRTDRLFFYTLLNFQQASTLVNACSQPNIREELRLMNDDLEDIQKSLDDYLERKRQEFPRFYFVSNSDMLEILGEAKDPEKVQKHIKKCFQGIKNLDLVPPGRRGNRCWEADGFTSCEGERLKFTPRPITVEGGVEQWLNKITRAMRDTLRKQLVAVHQQSMAHGTKKDKWIKDNCFQLVITSSQISWTMETESALRRLSRGNKLALKTLKRHQSRQLLHLAELMKKAGSDRERMKLKPLVTIEVHNRDVHEKLMQSRCDSEHHFSWTSQLRMELREDFHEPDRSGTSASSTQPGFSGALVCQCLQTETVTPYGYEYQGIYSRLVITPLTDQCFMALTFALHLRLGGSCQGPAGTGKTETVKDLGKTLAKFVIVFNCSDALDFMSLGRIFSGLAQSGAWCCFDEEIASDEHVQRKFFFEGQRVRLDPGCGIFTTMNPGYKGRAELPDNLKSLFRPVAMMTPDAALICEILLMAEGFDNARMLSRKATSLFQLMAQQLSKQDHYDFGLRPIRAALQRAGEIKRQANESITEQASVIQAILDTVVPKAVPEDLDILFALVKDLFPEAETAESESETLREALEVVIEKNGWTKVEHQATKAQQLYQCMRTRHGNMLVGSTLSGKSTVLSILEQALTYLNSQGLDYPTVRKCVVNPKSLDGAELYGGFSPTTREWTDGVFSALLRTCCNEAQLQNQCSRWVVLDGPVDTTWVESMNSLLDDNKTLTLTNGDRIELHPQVSLLFEVENLSAASPATVSRVGIIFMDPTMLGGIFTVENHAVKDCEQVVNLSEIGAVISLCRLFGAFASNPTVNNKGHGGQSFLEKLFLFSLTWSVGATVAEASRQHFDSAIRQLSNSFPPLHTVYDYALSSEKGDWTLWEDRGNPSRPAPMCDFRPLDGMPFHRIFVPTADVMCHAFLLGGLMRHKVHALVVGSRGCGKTSCIKKAVIDDLPDSVYTTMTLTFSSQTSSKEAQEGFESKLEKRVKGKWGPPGRKLLLCFVDDLNMPKPDEFGSQPPLELLRHFLDYGCWYEDSGQGSSIDALPHSHTLQYPSCTCAILVFRYDRSRQSLKVVLDMQLIAAMGAPEGGRTSIASRLLSRFNTIAFLEPPLSRVNRIYQTLVVHKFSDFKEDVRSIAENIALSTVALHQAVRQTFRPKPGKPHYLFSMRDMSKVVQGLYQADHRCIEDRDILLRLWYHECQRVYQDRLASTLDAERFIEILDSILEKNFQMRTKDLTKERGILFSHMRLEQSGTLSLGGGHMLLVGIGGSGRKSLATFATKLLNQNLWRIRVTKNFTVRDFQEELKEHIVKAGRDGIRSSLLLTDKDLKTDAFSDCLNSLLGSGQVPGMLDAESLGMLLKDLQPAAEAAKASLPPDAMIEFFQARVRENLRVLLCVSPIGSTMRDYCRMFPAFINETTIDWFFTWPQEALEEVAATFLESADIEASTREAVARASSYVHMDAVGEAEAFRKEAKRTSFITPTKFLRLVRGYCHTLKEKKDGVHEKIDKLSSGLGKLVEAREQVEAMNEELEAKKEDVARKQRECDELMVVIVEKRTLADEQMKQVEADSARIQTEEMETKILSDEARRDLAKAMPALEAAIDALEKLDKKSVAEVKAYTKPPDLVVKTMAAVMTVMEKSPSWSQAKIELNDPSFLTRVKNFDKDSITNATLKKIEKFTKDPSFAPPNVQKVSRAAGALCLWVHAMQMYAEVYREVEPKRLKLRLAEEELEKKQNDLRLARKSLEDIQGRLEELNSQYDESLRNKSELNSSAEELRVKLERAESLITGLADERDRWELSLESYKDKLGNIPGDALLGSAFMSYAGPFTSSYRSHLVKDLWMSKLQDSSIPCSADFDFTDFFVTPVDVRQWQLDGLPTDPFSAENGVLITKASKWPLIIDPQNQANRWIRKLKSSQITVVDPESKSLLHILHLSVQTGRCVLLERLQTQIDPSLEPIITKNVVDVNGKSFISIGDKLVPFDGNFSLWMTTKIGNPLFPPEIEAEVTLINFVIMQDGLTEQLLGIVVMKEEPSLEAHKHALVLKLAEGRKRLQDIEDQILRLLTDARGCLLDDLELIRVLQDSKRVAGEVSSQIEVSERTMKKIDQAREAYRPCGHRASVLYFVLQDLAMADSMYQFSLDAYEELFVESIQAAMESNAMAASAEDHVMTLNADHTLAVYKYARQGMFERHKPLLSLHLCASVLLADDQINRQEYAFLFTHGGVPDSPPPVANPDPEWISPAVWQLICKADQLEGLQGLQSSIEQNLREWRRWFGSPEPERATLPGDWQSRLDALQRLIVIRCLRPDRIIPASSRFVTESMDSKFVEYSPLDWEELLSSSKSSVPLLFILSGVDPVGQLMAFATSKNTTVVSVALGQGQALRAEQVIRDGARHGFWVFLANCHLAVSWLPALEKLAEETLEAHLHPDFRLWLSSEPTPHFPLALLQRSTKICIERPRGVKANLQRLLQQRTEEDMQRVAGGEERYKRLFFSLCWLHSLLIERGKFHNFGWNTPASFSDSDFFVGDSLLATYCEQSASEFPWDAVRFRIAGACYGGRLTDERDMRLLRVYCNDCFNPQVLANDFKFQGLQQYPMPEDTSLTGLRQYVRELPAIDPPELFGQHVNAEIQSQIEEAEELFATLLSIQLPGADLSDIGDAESRESRVLRCCDHLESVLPNHLDIARMEQATFEDSSPLRVVMIQEAHRLNRLLACVTEMVRHLKRGVAGLVVMSEDLESLQCSLLNGKVPQCWEFAFPSLKPLTSWAYDVSARVDQISRWGLEGQPKAFWLGGLTYPSAFLTALLQQFARRNSISVDTISFEFVALTTYDENTITSSPREGAYVKRLYLEGASWNVDSMSLREPEPMQLICEMPIVHFKPVARRRVPPEMPYMCPIYQYPCRTGSNGRPSLKVGYP
ncbi:hypothetical protein EPH_0040020 [Eimeria praecox]|uniref:Dynein heavy chain, cytoplasmic n=1 Tax=Eimeria praecox TaxID=51316 RepID=U6GQS2_9EIME|nr:hypothetical protein EPH_0040020 [Eimeria praecox]